MDWTILGIAPTKDKKAITAAYRAKLKHTNPEEKPEEFKALRAAYEQALEYAAKADEVPAADNSPVGQWMSKVRALYDNFPLRITTEAWADLLMEDAVVAMDTRPKAEEALLRFFMDDYFIPNAVWRLLDANFRWTERTEELYELFPKDFIDYAVVNGVRLEANLPYDMFTPGLNAKDCDQYRRLYHQASQAPFEELCALLDDMEALSESHPYGVLLRCRAQFAEDETRPMALETSRSMAERYPTDQFLLLEWASMCMLSGDWTEAERVTEQVLALNPEHFNARRMLAEALAKRGEYDKAKEQIYDLMRSVGGDQMQTFHLGQTLQRWNHELIAQKEALLREDPTNTKNVIELGWCYLQNDRFDDALLMALQASPDYEDQYDYYNYLAKVHYAREEYEAALKNFYELERVMRGLDASADEKTAKRKRRLPEVVQLQGSCLMALEREEEGKRRYLDALALDPDNAEILTYTARMFAGTRDYEAALPLLERVIDLMPTSYHGHFLMAQVLFELNRDSEALYAVDKALNFEGSDLGVYVLKMRIFLRNGVWEPVEEIIEFLEMHKVGDDASVLWCKGQLAEFAHDNREEALALYRQAADKLENGGAYMEKASKLYYRMAALFMEKLDMNRQEDRDTVLELTEKGLKHDPEDPNCLEYKGWLLRRNDKIEEALEIFHKLEAYAQHPLSVEYNLAELYYKDLKKNARKALEYYKKLIEKDESGDLHFYAGTACRYLMEFNDAEWHFLQEQAWASEDVDGYNGLAYVYEAMYRNADALYEIDRALQIAKQRDAKYLFLYTHKVQILRRMNKPQEAMEVVRQAMELFENYNGYDELYEICAQFGLWNEAEQVLKEQKQLKGPGSRWAANRVKMLCMTKHPAAARLEFVRLSRYMDEDDKEDVSVILADLNGKLDKVISVWEKKLDGDGDMGLVYLTLALNEVQRGNRKLAEGYAAKALEDVDRELQGYLTNEALYRTRRAVLLAILGRADEAWKELDHAQCLPLCAGCPSCKCKDADLFEANMYEILGDKKKALELYEKYHRQWPDEPDMLGGLRRLKKQGI